MYMVERKTARREVAAMKWRFLISILAVVLAFFFESSGKEVAGMETLKVTSSVFKEGGAIPKQYTCDGKDVNPPLMIGNVPKEAKSLALIVDDPDAPGRTWVHWVLWNIDPGLKEIAENAVPAGARQGKNDFGRNNYGGPCPPSGAHRYLFKVYALGATLDIGSHSTKAELERAMKGHILAEGHVMGLYQRR